MVELLLIEGSEVDVRDNVTGKTALIKAAYGGHFKVVNLLLEAEADPDAVDSQGYGALAFAASRLGTARCSPRCSSTMPIPTWPTCSASRR